VCETVFTCSASHALCHCGFEYHLAGAALPAIVDLKWRLDYLVSSKGGGKLGTPMYLIDMHLDDPVKGLVVQQFTCTPPELEELRGKVKDALRAAAALAAAATWAMDRSSRRAPTLFGVVMKRQRDRSFLCLAKRRLRRPRCMAAGCSRSDRRDLLGLAKLHRGFDGADRFRPPSLVAVAVARCYIVGRPGLDSGPTADARTTVSNSPSHPLTGRG